MALIVSYRGRRLVVVASTMLRNVASRLRSDAPAPEILGMGRLAKVLGSLSMYGTSSRSRPARRGVPVEYSRAYLLTITSVLAGSSPTLSIGSEQSKSLL